MAREKDHKIREEIQKTTERGAERGRYVVIAIYHFVVHTITTVMHAKDLCVFKLEIVLFLYQENRY